MNQDLKDERTLASQEKVREGTEDPGNISAEASGRRGCGILEETKAFQEYNVKRKILV